jgi:hypothetical protein
MATTLLLNPATWDLTVDIDGNIAVASEPYSYAQDVASACRLFQGDLYYDTTQGVPYWQMLGRLPPIQFIKNAYTAAALTVPGITAANCFITGIINRVISGQIQTTAVSGATSTTRF